MADQEVQRVEVRDPERTNLWTGLAVGLGLAALAGVIVALILRRKDDDVSGTIGNHVWTPQAMTPIPGYDNLGASGVPHVPFANPHPSQPVPLHVPPRR